MQYLGVITDPNKQSTSPAFQQAAIDALGLGMVYERWPTPPDGLPTRVTGLRAPSVLGANVTIPHKEAVMPMLDELDPLAQRVGAVNTILNREGRLSGYNTDVEGFLRALREDAGFDPRGCDAVVAGAGGAARAVVVALIEAGAASIAVLNRSAERAQRLVDDLSPHAGGTWLEALPAAPGSWAKMAPRAQLLVNCTSVGMEGASQDAIARASRPDSPGDARVRPHLPPHRDPAATRCAASGARACWAACRCSSTRARPRSRSGRAATRRST